MRLEIRGEYPPDWPDISARVKREANYRCVRCNHWYTPGANKIWCIDDACRHPKDGLQRVLTVHHLDGDKSNVRWWNLLALCQVCHLSVQARVIPKRPYLWEHSDWAKVYIAGFYAWYYGEREVTRDEALAELEPLLVLGQPWRATA